jgi:hypothetical protein
MWPVSCQSKVCDHILPDLFAPFLKTGLEGEAQMVALSASLRSKWPCIHFRSVHSATMITMSRSDSWKVRLPTANPHCVRLTLCYWMSVADAVRSTPFPPIQVPQTSILVLSHTNESVDEVWPGKGGYCHLGAIFLCLASITATRAPTCHLSQQWDSFSKFVNTGDSTFHALQLIRVDLGRCVLPGARWFLP